MRTQERNLTGTLGVIDRYLSLREDNKNLFKDIKTIFFKPYKSPARFLVDLASIPAAPLIWAGLSAVFLLNAALELFKVLINLISLHPKAVKKNLKECRLNLNFSAICLLLVPFSPIINLIGVTCSSIATLKSEKNIESNLSNNYMDSMT